MCFILINSCIIFQIQFFNNLIFVRFKGIKVKYFNVYQKKIIKKLILWILFFYIL